MSSFSRCPVEAALLPWLLPAVHKLLAGLDEPAMPAEHAGLSVAFAKWSLASMVLSLPAHAVHAVPAEQQISTELLSRTASEVAALRTGTCCPQALASVQALPAVKAWSEELLAWTTAAEGDEPRGGLECNCSLTASRSKARKGLSQGLL